MTEEEMKAKLELSMLEEFDNCFYLTKEGEDDPSPWIVLIGNPHGCVPVEILSEDDLNRDIWKKFACYLRPLRGLAAEILGISYWDIDMLIDSSFEDYTKCVLYHQGSRKVLLEVTCKAWNFFWEKKEELLKEAYEDTMQVVNGMSDWSPNIWLICESDVQDVAEEKIGRQLTPVELQYAKKGIESGLGSCWCDYVEFALEDAVANPSVPTSVRHLPQIV